MLESYSINFIFLRSALLLQWTACLKRNPVSSRNPTDRGSQRDHQAPRARGRSILFPDPHRGVDEDHRPRQSKLLAGIPAHLGQIAMPFDFADAIRKALTPPHAQSLFQREINRRGVSLDTKHSNRFLQQFLIKHKTCALHVYKVATKIRA